MNKKQDFPFSKAKHNNDFKKPRLVCDGTGEVRSATKSLDGYDLEDCPNCGDLNGKKM